MPFRGLITKLATRAKVPLKINEPTMKMIGFIFAVTIVKYEAQLFKKRSQNLRVHFFTSWALDVLLPSPRAVESTLATNEWYCWQVRIKSIQVEEDIIAVHFDYVQANEILVQLSLDVQQLMEKVMYTKDDENEPWQNCDKTREKSKAIF